jgi:integrase-like protein
MSYMMRVLARTKRGSSLEDLGVLSVSPKPERSELVHFQYILRHTYGSLLAMKGVPMAVIAEQLGHSDTRMTERHYAHLGPSYVADTIRASFPTLGILDAGNVTSLSTKRKKG